MRAALERTSEYQSYLDFSFRLISHIVLWVKLRKRISDGSVLYRWADARPLAGLH